MTSLRRVAVMIDLDQALGHHHQMFAGIHRYARESGRWECVLNPYVELDAANSAGLDGVVGRITPRLAAQARKARVPVVNVWLNSPARGLPMVIHDAEASGRMAAEHLLARGFRSLAYLGFLRDRTSRLQWAGVRSTLSAKRYWSSPCWVGLDFTRTAADWNQLQTQLKKWIDRWPLPIGVVVTNDLLCRHLAEVCMQRRLEVPHQVALVGSSNEKVVCADADPALSSIDFGFDRIGYRAAKLLEDLMDGAPPPAEPIRLPPIELVARQSSDAFAVDDPLVAKALRFMAEHAHERIGVEEVVAHVAAARRTLSRMFLKSLGRTIHDMLTHLRLERAKRQLIEPGAVLKTVANECGFRDAIHLHKIFQKAEGIAPGEYRATRTTKDLQ